MIQALIEGIFNLITMLVNLILTPINLLIDTYMPSISSAMTTIANLFTILFQYSGWVLDALLISPETIALLIALLTMRYTIPFMVYAVKLAIQWYNHLKI